MSKIPGISEHLFNHIKKRMVKILNRCKIPVFDVEDYTFNKKLGEGSYAVIFSVYKNSDKEKKPLALKKIIAKTLTEIDKLTKEFELVHCCLHPNIMEIYGICIRMLDQTTYALYVLMELSHGDWDKEIKMHIMKKKYYLESELINILRQLTGALLFMQQNLKISHRDIKPQNVLLFGNGLYKIADFGEAKEAKLSKQVNTLRGTELYMSPALYSGLKNDKNDVNHDPYKSDVFSLGFCFFYASTLNFNVLYQVRDIYNSNRMNDIIQQHLNKKYSPTFISILSHMMEVDESERFDFPTLVKFIDGNYDENGNLKNEEKIEKKSELSQRSNRKKK
jgi:serine/threonine protein kinase